MPRALLHRTGPCAALLAALTLAAACGSAQTPPPTPAPAAAPDSASQAPPAPQAASPDSGVPAWMLVDSAARTVTLTLAVTPSPDGGAALVNGYRNGQAQIVVPLNWTVQWDWHSTDSTKPHSLVVMAEREKLPTEGGRPAFTNAMTRMVTAGLPAGQRDQTTFTADQPGWYWMLCGVPEHALAGEYIGLRVDPEAKTAWVKAKA
jgi:hypothetical protein